jgi:hypothetical protein
MGPRRVGYFISGSSRLSADLGEYAVEGERVFESPEKPLSLVCAQRDHGPPGSSCSIQIGNGLTDAPVGSLRNVYLVVTDLEAARSRLLERGVDVGEIRHKTPIGAWDGGFAPGLDPARGDYASCTNFSDPDGNS